MRLSLFSASSLLFLLGCPTTVVVDPPAPAEVVRLESGRYGVLVTDVLAIDCHGARDEDFYGMELPMQLRMGGGAGATADLSGLRLTGGMSAGVLELDGEFTTGQDRHDEDRSEPEPCEPADGDGDGDVEPVEAGGEQSEEKSGEDQEVEEVECGNEERPDQPSHGGGREGVVSLEIVASRPDHGAGFLVLTDRDCQLELAVEVQAVHRGEAPPPVHTTDEEPDCEDQDGDGGDCY